MCGVKCGVTHSLPTSVAVALLTPSILSFINQFQRFEHCGLLNIQRIAAASQPYLASQVLFSRMP